MVAFDGIKACTFRTINSTGVVCNAVVDASEDRVVLDGCGKIKVRRVRQISCIRARKSNLILLGDSESFRK